MVSQVGFNSNTNNYLMGLNGLPAGGYQDDFLANSIGITNNNTLQTDTVSFRGKQNPNETKMQNELTNCLLERDKDIAYTENGNGYKKTSTGKVLGTIGGFIAPIGMSLLKLLTEGGGLKNALKLKQLAITCPALAAIGLGIGAFIDNIKNNNRAQTADAAATTQQQQQCT